MHEILSPEEMGRVDRLAAEAGPLESYDLMRNAGAAVMDEILSRFADAPGFDVLCGPGNNGGDGYVVARLLHERGLDARVWRELEPKPGSDAARAAAAWPMRTGELRDFAPEAGRVVVDALFGAGLAKPVSETYANALDRVSAAGPKVVAVDLPSGVSGRAERCWAARLRPISP
ncbi:NAD(P)H-hydrate epimerase [Chelativorans sp. AA-79]|uniref:NAD(P)H-hydrate epimerase n=1 Tax=Chelativorans sp. AA-79 TaxID=3028735 RepID=UPI003211F444